MKQLLLALQRLGARVTVSECERGIEGLGPINTETEKDTDKPTRMHTCKLCSV